MNLQFNSTAPPVSIPVSTPSAATASSGAASQAPPPKAAPAAQQPSAEQVHEAARKTNEYLKSQSASVEFSVDAKSDQVIVKIVDPDTKTLIRQIPSEEMIAISEALDNLTGLLVRQKA